MSRIQDLERQLAMAREEEAGRPGAELEQVNKDLEAVGSEGQGEVMDDVPIFAWQIRGIIGGINLLMRMTGAGRRLPESWAKVLRDTCQKTLELLPKE